MNDMVPVGSTAIALPEGTALAAVFRAENGIDPIIAAIAAEVRAHVPDTSTKKGRDSIASLAYRVSRSKTVLDDAGKSLNEAARAEISIVDAARRKVREQLDALRDEARKPLDDWEAAEEQRLNLLKSRLRALDAGRADVTQSADHIAAVLAEVEARAEADRKESAERAAKEAEEAAERKLAEEKERHEREIAEAKRRADEAAQRERDRLADERRAEAEAQQRREENTRIRNRIKREIAKAIDGMTADEIAEALTAGRVPHCTVTF